MLNQANTDIVTSREAARPIETGMQKNPSRSFAERPTKDISISSGIPPSEDVLQSTPCTRSWEDFLANCFCCYESDPTAGATAKLIADYTENESNFMLKDDASFDGSISTKGSMCSSVYSNGRHAGPSTIMRTSSSLLQRPSILKRQDSHRSEKSARFNDMMNQTVQYSPGPSEYRDYNIDGDGDLLSIKSTRSAGGQAKYLTLKKHMKLRNDQRFDASVVGTSSKDDSVHPRILNLDLMDAIQKHLPCTKRGQLFWLKYSMVRDGASMHSLLQKTEASTYNIFAIETMEGEVFGAFTSHPWTISRNFYGSSESFLWRSDGLRDATRSSKQSESSPTMETLQVFPFAGNNWNIQLCTSDSLSVGGGHPDESSVKDFGDVKFSDWGFGLNIREDMQKGTSSPCITFESPSLSKFHDDGSCFEISNIEVWSLTPCITLEQATKLEETKRCIQRCLTF